MNSNALARIASLVGEPARAAMLMALMDGRSLTARELADAARIAPPTASRHLGLLVEAGLLHVSPQGRHRYHRLASAEVARVLEGILQLGVAAAPPLPVATGPRDATMRFARTCYDHLAGRLAVGIVDRLVEQRALVIDDDTAQLTSRAQAALQGLGFDAGTAASTDRRPPCRPCLDWGERRMHLAGRVGVLLCKHCLQQGWLLQHPKSRALTLAPSGAIAFRNWFGVERWTALTDAPARSRFPRTG
ncbi:helix-turn-helix transcriptional regulator [Ramlibacter sp. PS3R-8]|uniref:ArsR/SmtB family transcription factor n=1 Tax=Ramlibacter sp. PS3R-8 TaxID=3133437 RepID=UPI00309E9A65